MSHFVEFTGETITNMTHSFHVLEILHEVISNKRSGRPEWDHSLFTFAAFLGQIDL